MKRKTVFSILLAFAGSAVAAPHGGWTKCAGNPDMHRNSLQFAFMERHGKIADGVFCVTYSHIQTVQGVLCW